MSVPGPSADPRTTSVAVTPLFMALVWVSLAGGLAGVVAHRAELVVLVAPAMSLLAFGMARTPGRLVPVEATLDVPHRRFLVDDVLDVTVSLRAPVVMRRLEIAFGVRGPVDELDGSAAAVLVLYPNIVSTHTLSLRGRTIGRAVAGPVVLRWHDRFGLLRYERTVLGEVSVNVLPSPDDVRSLVHAAATGAHVGEQLARRRGDGFEHADTRPWRNGDGAHRINWRVTARRDDPWVVERHPDRNEDVVLFVDTFADAVSDRGESSLRLSLEVAAAVGSAHLAHRDRVGFVGYGGSLRWLMPGTGQLARYRLVDAIVETQVFHNESQKQLERVPARALPPRALVIAITPLMDQRGIDAVHQLAARGNDLAVIAIDPVSLMGPLPADSTEFVVLGRRLWRLEQERQRAALRGVGVAVVEWPTPGDPGDDRMTVEGALRQLSAWRRTIGRRRMAG